MSISQFINRIVEDENKYEITIDGTTKDCTLVSKEVVITEGTPLNAANMNNIVNTVNANEVAVSTKQEALTPGDNISITSTGGVNTIAVTGVIKKDSTYSYPVEKIAGLTKSQYNALTEIDNTTLYILV